MLNTYKGNIDDQEALRAYLAQVLEWINELKERYEM